MAEEREPMAQVRREFRIAWYRSPIEPARLKELTRRSDLRGAVQAGGHLLLLAITAAVSWYCFDRGLWVGFALGLFAHGTVYSFLAGLATHELAHGTVFRTRWLGEAFLRVFSLLSWFNFHDYRMSHTYHHLYTLHPRGDREVVLPNVPSLHPLHILQLFTLNLVGAPGEPYSFPVVRNIGATVKLAFTGKFGKQWLEDVYADQPQVRRKSIAWARLTLAFHAVLLVLSVVFRLWPLPLLVSLAPFIANWLRYFVGVPMHTGLRDQVADFRLCVRSITLDPLSQFLYWRMNWHTEHHMYAAVPCYNLKRLSRAIASDLPQPRTLIEAWREMRSTWKRQQTEPGYQFETPLPGGRAGGGRGEGGRAQAALKPDALESSLGELAPKDLEQQEP